MRNFEQLNRFYQPRRDMARSMMQSGMSTAPVQHWTQGLGRLAQALVGAHLNKKLDAEMEEKLAKRQGKMSEMIKSLMTEKIGEEDIGIEEQFQEQGGLNKFTPPTPESLGISPPIDEVTGEPQKSYANDMDKFKMITDAQTIADGGIPSNPLSPGSNEVSMGKFTQPQRYQGTGEGYARATNDVMGLGKMGKLAMAMNEMSPGGMDMSPLMQYQALQEGRKYSSELAKQKRGYDVEDADTKFERDKLLRGIPQATQFNPKYTTKPVGGGLVEPGYYKQDGSWVKTGKRFDPKLLSKEAASQRADIAAGKRPSIEELRQQEEMKLDVKAADVRKKNHPNHRQALIQQERKSATVVDNIRQARKEMEDWRATGAVGAIEGIMPWSSPNSRLRGYLDTVVANLGFDKLADMRKGSATGASGLGSLSTQEMRLLTAVQGALDPKDAEVLERNLKIIEELYPVVMQEEIDLYNKLYPEDPYTPQRRKTDQSSGWSIKRVD